MSTNLMQAVRERAECLYTTEQVDVAIAHMAAAITARCAGRNPLVLGVMTGAIVPMGLLLPLLDFPLEIDYLHASRYRGETQGRDLRWQRRNSKAIAGRQILVIDDILDEGHTLEAIVDYCASEGAAEVLSAVLVEKAGARKVDMRADIVGLEVPNRYVFGYGMDYKEYWRNAPGIFAVHPDDL